MDDVHDGGDKIIVNKKNPVTEFDIAPYEDVMNDFVEHVLTQDNVTEKDIEKALTDKKMLNKWVDSFMGGGDGRCMALTLKQRNEIENARNWCEKELESGEESSMLGKREREDDPCKRLVKKSVTQTQSQNVSSNCYTDTIWKMWKTLHKMQ